MLPEVAPSPVVETAELKDIYNGQKIWTELFFYILAITWMLAIRGFHRTMQAWTAEVIGSIQLAIKYP